MSGHGDPIEQGELSAEEALRYCDEPAGDYDDYRNRQAGSLAAELKIAQGFKPMTVAEMQALRERTRQAAGDGRYELYRGVAEVDNPQARIAHDFPIDEQSPEVKEMLEGHAEYGTSLSGCKNRRSHRWGAQDER